jgi:hypothetical protein
MMGLSARDLLVSRPVPRFLATGGRLWPCETPPARSPQIGGEMGPGAGAGGQGRGGRGGGAGAGGAGEGCGGVGGGGQGARGVGQGAGGGGGRVGGGRGGGGVGRGRGGRLRDMMPSALSIGCSRCSLCCPGRPGSLARRPAPARPCWPAPPGPVTLHRPSSRDRAALRSSG